MSVGAWNAKIESGADSQKVDEKVVKERPTKMRGKVVLGSTHTFAHGSV